MDRRRASVALLLLFVACTGVAIVISGSRPGLQQGIAPVVAQVAGYLSALTAAGLLLASESTRAIGATVLGALLVLVLLDLFLLDGAGSDIGGGLVRLAGLVVITVATVRLARGLTTAGPAR